MAIKDSIAKLRKALRTTQTNAPAVIDTLVRGLDGVEEAAEEENTYSTDEKEIGSWIDGSKLYEKVINIGALPDSSTKAIDLSALNIDKIIEFNGYATTGTINIPIQYAVGGTAGFIGVATYYTSNNGRLTIETYNDRSSYTECYMIIKYTKASASRSPEENDTKSNGDEEKNGNER